MGFANNAESFSSLTYSNPLDGNKSSNEIHNFIEEGFETIYNTDPSAANYFIVSRVYDPFNYKDTDFSTLFRRYCQSITLSDNIGIQFNTDFFKSRGQSFYQISSIGRNQSVKIEYLDDAPRTMLHVHKNWIDAWFNGGYNAFAIGAAHKFRNMDIQFFRMTPTGPQIYAKATLINMVPSDAGHIFDANYSQPGNENKYTVTYTIDRVDFAFYANDSSSLNKLQLLPWKNIDADNFTWNDSFEDKKGSGNFTKMKRY